MQFLCYLNVNSMLLPSTYIVSNVTGAAPVGDLGDPLAAQPFCKVYHFLFSGKKCLYANKQNQDKLLS